MLAKYIFVLINGKPGGAYSGLGGLIFVKGLVSSAPLKCKQRLGLQGQIFFLLQYTEGYVRNTPCNKYVLYEFVFL
jgi:hypothetical protein